MHHLAFVHGEFDWSLFLPTKFYKFLLKFRIIRMVSWNRFNVRFRPHFLLSSPIHQWRSIFTGPALIPGQRFSILKSDPFCFLSFNHFSVYQRTLPPVLRQVNLFNNIQSGTMSKNNYIKSTRSSLSIFLLISSQKPRKLVRHFFLQKAC